MSDKPLRYRHLPFWARVQKGDHADCWPWLGAATRDGYGRLTVGGVQLYAHRHAYELEVGAIPEGLTIDHLCRNRLCCNPAHFEITTRSENGRRGGLVGGGGRR